VLASDSDPIAAEVAAANVHKNCVWPSVRVLTAEGFAHPRLRGAKPDLIFANLLANLLYDLAPAMRRQLVPGGIVVLSGITRDQSRGIEARYRAHDFVLNKRIQIDGWTTLVLTRR
jgi:ribosomal protein L11 methyltransferase